MTALSTEAICSRLREASPVKRLVISPLLDEDGQTGAGQASVDIRLGFHFCLVIASSFGAISEFDENGIQPSSFTKLYRSEYVPFGSKIVIHPHQLMLAQIFEYIRLPTDLMAYVVGRSTWGRLGLIVATAIGVHPGFAGNLTFELRNLGETPLTLYPGQTIAQLFFHHVVDSAGQPSAAVAKRAQYAGTVDMVPQRISSDSTHNALVKLIDRFERLSKT
jgi:dCTP deaminase